MQKTQSREREVRIDVFDGARERRDERRETARRHHFARITELFFQALDDAESLRYATEHRDVIRRFGRFPGRNLALGRATTPAEQAFLDNDGSAGRREEPEPA